MAPHKVPERRKTHCVPKNQLVPSEKEGFDSVFGKGSCESPVPTSFEIPWFFGWLKGKHEQLTGKNLEN